eukprot:6207634-Pleurochrysis_carterae.AAC.2
MDWRGTGRAGDGACWLREMRGCFQRALIGLTVGKRRCLNRAPRWCGGACARSRGCVWQSRGFRRRFCSGGG